MTTTTPHPPTTLHESIPLTPSSAESFLSSFLADASRKPNQNEIVLTNLLRVQQALTGVYVPPPAAAEMEVLTKGEAGMGEIVREVGREGECGEERVDGEKERVEVAPQIATAETAEAGEVDREKRRKARKRKARKMEERKAKRERKRAEKEKGEKGEKGSESE